jgi:hypothetical protein
MPYRLITALQTAEPFSFVDFASPSQTSARLNYFASPAIRQMTDARKHWHWTCLLCQFTFFSLLLHTFASHGD